MKLLLTGICGFVGSSLAHALKAHSPSYEIVGIDNLIRAGSETNLPRLKQLGVQFIHADVRSSADFEALPEVDFVIDAAANPNVLAGVDGKTSSRQLIEHNLQSTVNMLEYCKRVSAGFMLISTSRVYAILPLCTLPLEKENGAYVLRDQPALPEGISSAGLNETFSTQPPLSLYGTSKLSSELLALEYGQMFGFPVWINRCGILAGEGQFGHPHQGLFSYWIHSWVNKRPLKYIGFEGQGLQVRDCLHPDDLATLMVQQLRYEGRDRQPIQNVSGGIESAISLAQLSQWCRDHLGEHQVTSVQEERPFDIPWIVLDTSLAKHQWDWSPKISNHEICERLARHAHENPHWLALSAGR